MRPAWRWTAEPLFAAIRTSVSAVGHFGTKRAPKDRAAFHIGFSPQSDGDHRRFTKIVAGVTARGRDSAVEAELARAIVDEYFAGCVRMKLFGDPTADVRFPRCTPGIDDARFQSDPRSQSAGCDSGRTK